MGANNSHHISKQDKASNGSRKLETVTQRAGKKAKYVRTFREGSTLAVMLCRLDHS